MLLYLCGSYPPVPFDIPLTYLGHNCHNIYDAPINARPWNDAISSTSLCTCVNTAYDGILARESKVMIRALRDLLSYYLPCSLPRSTCSSTRSLHIGFTLLQDTWLFKVKQGQEQNTSKRFHMEAECVFSFYFFWIKSDVKRILSAVYHRTTFRKSRSPKSQIYFFQADD